MLPDAANTVSILGLTVDKTVHLSDLVMVIGGLASFVKVGLWMRDGFQNLTNAMGSRNPRTGALGDIEHLKDEQRDHRDWLIGAGLDRRRGIGDLDRRHHNP